MKIMLIKTVKKGKEITNPTSAYLSILHPGSKPTELSKLRQPAEKGTGIANDVGASVTDLVFFLFLVGKTNYQSLFSSLQ
jgi:hypothetical protein